jgi:DNA relaxase NicK
MRRNVKAITSGFDWITATSNNETVGQTWYGIFCEHRKTPRGREYEFKDRKWYGYEGIDCGEMYWGTGKNGYIIQTRGAVSDWYFDRLVIPRSKVTRLDIAVTVELDKPVAKLAEKHYNILVRKGILDRYATVIKNTRGGSTLYVGSRKSEQFGRLYDKSARHGGEEGKSWRYEIELKKPRSDAAALEFGRHLEASGPSETFRLQLAAWVYKWWINRGVHPIWKYENGQPIGEIKVDYTQTSKDRKLTWLRSQVRPTIQWLAATGCIGEVAQALGLDSSQLELPGLTCPECGCMIDCVH